MKTSFASGPNFAIHLKAGTTSEETEMLIKYLVGPMFNGTLIDPDDRGEDGEILMVLPDHTHANRIRMMKDLGRPPAELKPVARIAQLPPTYVLASASVLFDQRRAVAAKSQILKFLRETNSKILYTNLAIDPTSSLSGTVLFETTRMKALVLGSAYHRRQLFPGELSGFRVFLGQSPLVVPMDTIEVCFASDRRGDESGILERFETQAAPFANFIRLEAMTLQTIIPGTSPWRIRATAQPVGGLTARECVKQLTRIGSSESFGFEVLKITKKAIHQVELRAK